MIHQYIYRTIGVLCTLFVLAGCGREDEFDAPVTGRPEGVALRFTAQYAGSEDLSRATAGKTRFENGDVIHLAARFYEGKVGDGEKGKKLEAQYCAYKYQNGDWESIMTDHEITWPYGCDYGLFTAYYITHANGAVSEETGTTATWSLSEIAGNGISDDTGPMISKEKAFAFGHTVDFEFSHACARLSVTRLETSTMSEYWFSKPDDSEFHNAYQLVRSKEEGIQLKWVTQPSESYGAYISRSLDRNIASEHGNTVTLYLEPGNYSGAKLNYRFNRNYISIKSEKLNGLEANHSYVLDITREMGIVFEDPDDGGWTDPDEPSKAHKLKDIPAFVTAASDGNAYKEDDTQILERTSTGVLLLVDVDFQGKDPLSAEDFPDSHLSALPDLSTSVTFDGNFHYIHNSVRPVFGEIQGRLYNLGISNMKRVGNVHPGTYEYGGLSRSVNGSGTVSNIRVSNLTLTLNLPYTGDIDVYNIGCVTGFNEGKVSDIAVRGKIELTIRDDDESQGTSSEICIGGIIGQNGGTLSGCSTFDNNGASTCITIKNTCKNKLPMATGGVVGYSFNNVEDITLKVDVDASESTASLNYTGGMAGRLRRSDGISETRHFKNISVEGSVKGGQGVSSAGQNGKSFTGGISGRLFNFFIENCNALCDVQGWGGDINTGVRYATGGAFGCIVTGETEKKLIFRSSWWGTNLSGLLAADNCYLGTFAGIIPTHKSDEEYQGNGNQAKEMSGVGFSGGKLDDENTSNGMAE